MAWRGWRRESGSNETSLQEAERAMAAIFTPSHVIVKETPETGGATLRRMGQSLPAGEKGELASVASPTIDRVGKGVCVPSGQGEEAREAPRLRTLPPSPIAGYTLREEGVVDELVKPPRTLSVFDVQSLIAELSSIEQKAKYNVDVQLPQQVHNRGRCGIEFIVNPCLHMCGMYLMLWKTPRLYFSASPRKSLLFTQILAIMRWRLPEAKKESLARNHRRLLQATNARVTLSFLAGCAVMMVAVATRPNLDSADANPDVNVAKESVNFQKHSESALRWLWLVYYHHPAYQSLANGGRALPSVK